MNLFKKFARLVCVRRHRSTVPTGLLPLSEVKSVVVFFDESDPYCEPLKIRIKEFFGKRGAAVQFVSEFDKDLRTESDLFIALNTKPSIDEKYAASCSRARFKVGRHQLKGKVYDFVVKDPTEEPEPVGAAFDVIEKMLTSIL